MTPVTLHFSLPLLRRLSAICVSCSLFVGVALPALAAAPALNADVPTLIDSDSLEYDDARQISIFTGKVVLTRGPLSLQAHRLELRQAPNGDQFAVATSLPGQQVFVRQTNPQSVEVVEGYADRAEFDSQKDQLDFIGKAVVSRQACGQLLDQVRGERIRYNQATEVYSAEGNSNATNSETRRVRTVIGARQKSAETITSCQAAGGRS